MHSLRQTRQAVKRQIDDAVAPIIAVALESLAQVCYIQVSCGIKYRSGMGNRPEYGMVWRCIGEENGQRWRGCDAYLSELITTHE
jgi:hypothetical protein